MKTVGLFPIKMHLCCYTQNIAYGSSPSLHLWIQDSRDTCTFLFCHTLLEWRTFLISASFGVEAKVKYHDGEENWAQNFEKTVLDIMTLKRRGKKIVSDKNGSN